MSATIEPWLFWGGASLTVAFAVALVLRHRRRPDARLTADAEDPYHRWVQNVFLLVTGDCDYAHLPGAEARRMLAYWWDVYGPVEHQRVLRGLRESHAHDSAWDLVRFILVSRLGVAAGMIPLEVSWAEILPVARRLQAAYPDWRAMAQSYIQARRQWRNLPLDGSADDDGMMQILENLARLDDERWREQSFDTPLQQHDPEHYDG